MTPPEELIASVPHVARAVGRPWHYYITQSALVVPVTVACAAFLFAIRRSSAVSRVRLGLGVVAMVGVTLTVLGVRGQGLQMRYLAPGIGGLYLLLCAQLGVADPRRSLFPMVALACILFGAIQSGFYLQAVEFDEIVSLPEMAWKAWTGAASRGGSG